MKYKPTKEEIEFMKQEVIAMKIEKKEEDKRYNVSVNGVHIFSGILVGNDTVGDTSIDGFPYLHFHSINGADRNSLGVIRTTGIDSLMIVPVPAVKKNIPHFPGPEDERWVETNKGRGCYVDRKWHVAKSGVIDTDEDPLWGQDEITAWWEVGSQRSNDNAS